MSTASARDPHRIGTVGAAGLGLTLLAGIIRSDPALSSRLAAIASWLAGIVFQVTIVLSFLIGLTVIIYSQWQFSRGALSDRAKRRTAIGVFSVLGLSLGFPVVLIDDIVELLVTVFGAVGPTVPPETYFLASCAVFGLMSVCGVFGVLRRRFRAKRV